MDFDLNSFNAGFLSEEVVHDDEQIFLNNSRNIFSNVPYNKKEISALKLIGKNDQGISQAQLLRLIYSADFQTSMLKKNIKVYQSFTIDQYNIKNDPDYQKIIEILKSGLFYLFGRDSLFRPIILMNLQIFMNKSWTHEQIFKALKCLFYKIKIHVLQDYYVEQWVIVMNLEYNPFNLFLLQKEDILQLFSQLCIIFSCHLHKIYIINYNVLTQSRLFDLLKPINQSLRYQIVFIDKDQTLSDFLPTNQLEIKYSGTQKNNVSFWRPPSKPKERLTLSQKMKQISIDQIQFSERNLFSQKTGNTRHSFHGTQQMPSLNSMKRSSFLKICVIQENGTHILDEDIIIYGLEEEGREQSESEDNETLKCKIRNKILEAKNCEDNNGLLSPTYIKSSSKEQDQSKDMRAIGRVGNQQNGVTKEKSYLNNQGMNQGVDSCKEHTNNQTEKTTHNPTRIKEGPQMIPSGCCSSTCCIF